MCIENAFPKLKNNYRKISEKTPQYNCIAWAIGDNQKFWWPAQFPYSLYYYWPKGVPRKETVEAFIEAYKTEGFEVCEDGNYEEGFDKVAIFTKDGIPKHATKHVKKGIWSSKMGSNIDIEHQLKDIEGDMYGYVHTYMKRKNKY